MNTPAWLARLRSLSLLRRRRQDHSRPARPATSRPVQRLNTAWFRFDEVYPIAEHAMASPRHRLTTAQALAGARLGPALVWRATDTGDELHSTGAPAWFGEDRAEHTAWARTWQHTVTEQWATAAAPGYHTAYLPLDLPPGAGADRTAVIDLLREARATGRHWIALSIDPDQHHLITADAVRLLDHRDQIAPPDAVWVPARVTADAVDGGAYPALVADGYCIGGGDVIARFDRATVEQMVLDLIERHADQNPATDPMPGELAVLGFDGDVLVVSWEHDDGEQDWLTEIDRVHPDADGRYAAGAYLWPWRHRSAG
jgi:hypothetical protein